MNLSLELPPNDLKKLSDAITTDANFQTIQNKMRAAVLVCTQDLMNGAQSTALDKFNLTLPDDNNIDIALAAALDFLKQKGFIHTASVLQEEVQQTIFEEGSKKLEEMFHGEKNENYLNQIVSTVQ